MIQEKELKSLENRVIRRFHKALADYRLTADGDHILVAVSGGKDSLCLLELMARQERIHKPAIRVEAVHVRMENISYATSTDYLQRFCREWGVPFHLLTTRFDLGNASQQPADAKTLRRQKTPCFLCSWNRRKQIFNLAQQLGCNKIALGHHQDDIIHTALMNLLFQGRFEGMPASLSMERMPLTIIRPLCLQTEADLKAFAQMKGYEKQIKNCPYEEQTRRQAVAQLFVKMEQLNPEARFSIWKALESDGKML